MKNAKDAENAVLTRNLLMTELAKDETLLRIKLKLYVLCVKQQLSSTNLSLVAVKVKP